RNHADQLERHARTHAGRGHPDHRAQHPGRPPDPARAGSTPGRARAHRSHRRRRRLSARTGTTARVFNFSAGPAMLPEEVLAQIREDIPDWQGGMSVMEVSHRGKEFSAVAERAEQDLRDLLAIPADYAVLFAQGGATLQFAMVPLNLAAPGQRVDYVNTGSWSKKALGEAGRFADVNVAADAADSGYTDIPDPAGWRLSADAAYVHYTPNETIGGVEFHFVPDTGNVPLVADMS